MVSTEVSPGRGRGRGCLRVIKDPEKLGEVLEWDTERDGRGVCVAVRRPARGGGEDLFAEHARFAVEEVPVDAEEDVPDLSRSRW